jgi:hypothetical protein
MDLDLRKMEESRNSKRRTIGIFRKRGENIKKLNESTIKKKIYKRKEFIWKEKE